MLKTGAVSIYAAVLIVAFAFLAAILIINYAAAQEEIGGEIIVPDEKVIIPDGYIPPPDEAVKIPPIYPYVKSEMDKVLDVISLDLEASKAFDVLEEQRARVDDLASKYARLYDSCRFNK